MLKEKVKNFIYQNYLPIVIYGIIAFVYIFYLMPGSVQVSMVMKSEHEDPIQVFYDRGLGFNEADCITIAPVEPGQFKTYQAEIPTSLIRAIRIDPLMQEGNFVLKSIQVETRLLEQNFEGKDLYSAIIPLKQVQIEYDQGLVYGISSGVDPHFRIGGLRNLVLTSLGVNLLTLFGLALLVAASYKADQRIKQADQKSVFRLALIILSISFFVYYDFLTLEKLYLYRDIGSDTYLQFWPTLQTLHYHISNGVPMWSFNQGLGQNIFPSWLSNPFMWLPVLLGGSGLVFALPYMQVLQILISGIFFYLYLRQLSLTYYSSLIGALLYSFCGHMIMRGSWYIYASEVVVVAVVLYCYELFYNRKNIWLLPLASALLCMVRGPYHFMLYTMLLLFYAAARYAIDHDNIKKFFRHTYKLALYWGAGLFISALFILPAISGIMQSPRAESAVSELQNISLQSIFSLNTADIAKTIFLRAFSTDILGFGSYRSELLYYSGWGNYFEAPLLYAGVICLLLAPLLLLIRSSLRTKITYYFIYSLIFIYLLMPFARAVVSAFQAGSAFRHSSFWISIAMIIFTVKVIDYMLTSKERVKKIYLVSWAIFLAAMLSIVWSYNKEIVVENIYYACLVFIALYTLCLLVLGSPKYRSTGKLLLILLVIGEMTVFSYMTVNNRDILDADYLNNRDGYFDYTLEALAYLDQLEDTDFYRVEKKDYNSVFFCDSLHQNYYGTKSYHPFNNRYYLQFLDNLDVPMWRPESQHYIQGFIERYPLDTLVGIKYILLKDKENAPFGYQYLETVEDIHIFRNTYSLPLGFAYDSYIPFNDFSELTPEIKDLVLLDSYVLEPGAEPPSGLALNNQLPQEELLLGPADRKLDRYHSEYARLTAERQENSFQVEQFNHNYINGSIELKKPMMLFFSIPFDQGWSITVNGESREAELVNTAFIGLPLEEGEHQITLQYRSPFLLSGLIISIISLATYVIIVLLYYRKKAGPGNKDTCINGINGIKGIKGLNKAN